MLKYVALLMVFFRPFVYADDLKLPVDNNLENSEEKDRTSIFGVIDHLTASNSSTGTSFSGQSIGFNLNYAFYNKWAVGLGLKQTLKLLTTSSLVTTIDARLTYAITGKLIKHNRSVKLDGKEVFSSKDRSTHGFRAQLIFSQYYFNSTYSSVPFSGLGVAGYYEYQIKSDKSLIGGVRYDMTANSSTQINPIMIFFGFGFYL